MIYLIIHPFEQLIYNIFGTSFCTFLTCLIINTIKNYRRLRLISFRSNYSYLARLIKKEVVAIVIGCIICYLTYLFVLLPFVFVIGFVVGNMARLGKKGKRLEPNTLISKENDWRSVIGRNGPILTFICAMIFLIHGLWWIIMFSPLGISVIHLYEITCGILGILGIYFGLKHKEFARFLCLIAGILGVVGLIIPFPLSPVAALLEINFDYLSLFHFLSLDYFFAFLYLIGGLLSVASKNRYLNYYSDLYDDVLTNRKKNLP